MFHLIEAKTEPCYTCGTLCGMYTELNEDLNCRTCADKLSSGQPVPLNAANFPFQPVMQIPQVWTVQRGGGRAWRTSSQR